MECVSAFQKSVRRGLEEDALYWAVELDMSGQIRYTPYLWRRIKIIASEDVGLAMGPGFDHRSKIVGSSGFVSDIRALYENWKETEGDERRLFLVHAVMMLARARKSRMVDEAATVMYAQLDHREIPDYAVDKHSKRGRDMGRGERHWIEEGSMIDEDPPYVAVRKGSNRWTKRYEQLLLDRENAKRRT